MLRIEHRAFRSKGFEIMAIR